MDTRPEPARDDPSGDYEYDLAHEQTPPGSGGGAAGPPPGVPPAHRSGRATTSDMSYDEAHDF